MKSIYEKENIEKVVAESTSYTEVIQKLGRAPKGSNYKTVKKFITLYNIDTSHFDGGKAKAAKSNTTKLEDILLNKYYLSSSRLKERLFKEGLKEEKCEKCGITNWNGEKIVFELHHVNGNHYDNHFENLQILCPNCHSQTETYKGKGAKYRGDEYRNTRKLLAKLDDKQCLFCGKTFSPQRSTSKFCSRKCYVAYEQNLSNTNVLNEDTIRNILPEYNNISDLAKHFNVSRTTMRKYLTEYDLLDSFKGKYDLHSKKVGQYENGKLIKIWDSITDAEETLHLYDISKCCKLQRQSSGGFVWRYITDK